MYCDVEKAVLYIKPHGYIQNLTNLIYKLIPDVW